MINRFLCSFLRKCFVEDIIVLGFVIWSFSLGKQRLVRIFLWLLFWRVEFQYFGFYFRVCFGIVGQREVGWGRGCEGRVMCSWVVVSGYYFQGGGFNVGCFIFQLFFKGFFRIDELVGLLGKVVFFGFCYLSFFFSWGIQ